MIHTAGRWDPDRWPVYFLAQNVATLHYTDRMAEDHLLAVNEIRNAKDTDLVEGLLTNADLNVFIDSGVYNLTMTHAREHGISMDQALSLAPEEVDGFDALFDHYVRLMLKWGDRVWGYVEIDAGGRANKIRTRGRLEALGLKPMPVFHPLNDGIDYLWELAEQYDRICFGNVVQAAPADRKRLVATAWTVREKYPRLWIHLLGLTPSPLLLAFPCNSCDSSTWVGPARWGTMSSWAATQRLWDVGEGWVYDRDADSAGPRGHHKAWQLAAYDAHLVGGCMRRMRADREAQGWVSAGGG